VNDSKRYASLGLLESPDLLEYEAVHVWNITNGNRFETYAIKGEIASGDICINGAAAHLAGPGDLVIIAAFADMSDAESQNFVPRVVFVDAHNKISFNAAEIAGPKVRAIKS